MTNRARQIFKPEFRFGLGRVSLGNEFNKHSIVVICGVASVASLPLFSRSAHRGPAPTIELAVTNWI
jgi:hypothetical protein